MKAAKNMFCEAHRCFMNWWSHTNSDVKMLSMRQSQSRASSLSE